MKLFDRLVVTSLPLVPKPIVRRFASRYVAGETIDDALRVVKDLNAEGAMATLDVLGESVSERSKAIEAVEEYLRLLDEIAKRGLDSNVSIKPTMLGLSIDEGFCRDNVARIAEAAQKHGNFVRIDMEDRETTDATLRIYKDLHGSLGNVGVVLQAYMRRTPKDIEELPEPTAEKTVNIRLCKGIYVEPRTAAWKGYETIRLAYVNALEKLIARGIYPAIATHDEYLVAAAVGLVQRYQLPREGYEFQMLLGVDRELRRILLAEGHRLRVYVPYGRDWHPYSVRRLRENPEIARHVLRSMLAR